MFYRNRIFVTLYRMTIFLLGITGVAMNVAFYASPQLFLYYTIQSNILIIVTYGYITIRNVLEIKQYGTKGEAYYLIPSLQIGANLMIAITFVVYALLLSNIDIGTSNRPYPFIGIISNYLVHYIVPIMCILDWVLCYPKGKIKFSNIAIWIIPPLAYFGFAVIRAQLGGPIYYGSYYPYPFMDVDLNGWPKVIITIIIMSAIVVGVAIIVVLLDRLWAKRSKSSIN